MLCQHLKHVIKTVWNRGLVDPLEQLFAVSEDLIAGPELHDQLLQALTIEKQQLLRQMELVTFYTDDSETIVEKYWNILADNNGQDSHNELEKLISDSFSGIKDVSIF